MDRNCHVGDSDIRAGKSDSAYILEERGPPVCVRILKSLHGPSINKFSGILHPELCVKTDWLMFFFVGTAGR